MLNAPTRTQDPASINSRDRSHHLQIAAISNGPGPSSDDGEQAEALQRQSALLRGLGADILNEPVPDQLAAILHRSEPLPARSAPLPEAALPRMTRSRPRRLWTTSAFAMTLLGGIAIGWSGDWLLNSMESKDQRLARDVVAAYHVYAANQGLPIVLAADRSAELSTWISRSFGRTVAPPDLTAHGLEYVGGMLSLGLEVPTAAFFYVNEDTAAHVGVFFWPDENGGMDAELPAFGDERFGARFARAQGFTVAVLSNETGVTLDATANTVLARFSNRLTAGG